MNKINQINTTYFGQDTDDSTLNSRDYLLDDYRATLVSFTQLLVLSDVLLFYKKQCRILDYDYGGILLATASSEFAADRKVLLLQDIISNVTTSFVVNARKLLNNEHKKGTNEKPAEPGASTGRCFIRDIRTLNDSDLADKTNHPALELLKQKASTFNDKNYFDRLIKEWEAVALHKDQKPTKYSITPGCAIRFNPNQCIKLWDMKRSSLVKVDYQVMTKCLCEFAEIMELYLSINPGIKKHTQMPTLPITAYVSELISVYGSQGKPEQILNKKTIKMLGKLEPCFKLIEVR